MLGKCAGNGCEAKILVTQLAGWMSIPPHCILQGSGGGKKLETCNKDPKPMVHCCTVLYNIHCLPPTLVCKERGAKSLNVKISLAVERIAC